MTYTNKECLTERQQKEIKCLDYFKRDIKLYKGIKETSPEFEYFEITTKGKKIEPSKRLNQLLDTKRWRLRFMDLYEQGVLDGSVPYSVLLENTPEYAAEFMSVTMFKGADKQLIMRLWNELHK